MSEGQINTSENKSTETLRIESCLARFQADPDAGFDELAGLVYDRLRRLTARILNEQFPDLHGQTDDAFHEGLLKLRTALRSEGVSPRTKRELYGLAALQIRRTLQNLIQQRRRKGRVASLDQGEDSQGDPRPVDVGGQSLDPARLADWTEFQRSIEALNEELRAVVDLLFYHGLSQQEAADELQLPLTTVQWRWRSARIELSRAGTDLSLN